MPRRYMRYGRKQVLLHFIKRDQSVLLYRRKHGPSPHPAEQDTGNGLWRVLFVRSLYGVCTGVGEGWGSSQKAQVRYARRFRLAGTIVGAAECASDYFVRGGAERLLGFKGARERIFRTVGGGRKKFTLHTRYTAIRAHPHLASSRLRSRTGYVHDSAIRPARLMV